MSLLNDFDPTNTVHVKWLKELVQAEIEKKVELLQKNPMKYEVPPFEVIHILFGLSAKYTKAVFDKTAVILDV
jgi:hypothetical protein